MGWLARGVACACVCCILFTIVFTLGMWIILACAFTTDMVCDTGEVCWSGSLSQKCTDNYDYCHEQGGTYFCIDTSTYPTECQDVTEKMQAIISITCIFAGIPTLIFCLLLCAIGGSQATEPGRSQGGRVIGVIVAYDE